MERPFCQRHPTNFLSTALHLSPAWLVPAGLQDLSNIVNLDEYSKVQSCTFNVSSLSHVSSHPPGVTML